MQTYEVLLWFAVDVINQTSESVIRGFNMSYLSWVLLLYKWFCADQMCFPALVTKMNNEQQSELDTDYLL